jgi:glycerol-3-phosphate acyltransferase PlsY
VVAFAVCGALVVARHRENLGRLRRGEERTLAPGATD